jgi:membrane-associated phospholipid phosphatase
LPTAAQVLAGELMTWFLRLVTDLGDVTLLLPASALLLVYLLHLKTAQTATIWVSTVALCVFLTSILKLCFLACGPRLPGLDMQSPSGHVSMSITFYGCCALMVSQRREPMVRIALLSAAFALVVAVAVSRVVLHYHTPVEAAAGFLVGGVCVAWFRVLSTAAGPLSIDWRPIVVVMVALALALHGMHTDFEGVLRHFARLFQARLSICA